MQKKRVLLLIVALLVVVLSTTALFACNKDENKAKHALDLEEGTYPSALPSNFQGDELATVTAGLSSTATSEQVRSAVLAAYKVANRSRKTAENSLMLQVTDAGLMYFQGFELKSGNAWYYQLPTESALDPLSNTLVAYTLDSETFYFIRLDDGSAPRCKKPNFPYAQFVLTEAPKQYDFQGFKDARFFLDDQLELCNMNFHSVDLIDETSEISYDADKHVYTVKLVVDCTQPQETMAEWYEQTWKEGNKYSPMGAIEERYYKYWNAEIEIWENGYVKYVKYDEKWESDNFIVNSTATSEFKFFYDEDEILAFLKQDPKYAEKTEEEQAEMTTLASFIEMYSNRELQKAPLKPWHIAVIVIGCAIFAVIVIVVTIEILVKKGKLPKLAAKREAAKQKKLAKKQAKAAKKAGVLQEQLEETNFVEDEIPVEPADETAESKEEQAEEQTPEE